MFENKIRLKIVFYILTTIFIIFGGLVLVGFINVFFSFHKINFGLIWGLIKNNKGNLYLIVGCGLALTWTLFYWFKLAKKPKSRYSDDVNDKTFGNAKFLTKQQFNKKYKLVKLKDPAKNHGVVLNSFVKMKGFLKKKKTVMCNVATDNHVVTIATSGDGKSQGHVIPTLQLLANSKIKPSVFVADVKGELFESSSLHLKNNGYNVIVLNLKDGDESSYWNPLYLAFENWRKGCEYELLYNDKSNKNKSKEVKKYYQFQEEAKKYISDICATLVPENTDPKAKFFDDSARDLANGILLAMMYKMRDENKFEIERFNLASILPLLNNFDELQRYLEKLPLTHIARNMAGSILKNAKDTTGSILGTLKTALGIFNDSMIKNITTQHEIDFNEIVDKPTAIFAIVSHQSVDKHKFASMFISQVYKFLSNHAEKNGGRLKKSFYFLLDEFANFPKIDNMTTKISVSRGAGIFWDLILQDIPQLEEKYGKEQARTILNNCMVHLFIGTEDDVTAERYSKRAGATTKLIKNYSLTNTNQNNQQQKKQTSFFGSKKPVYSPSGSSASIQKVDLIPASELMFIPKEQGIVFSHKDFACKVKFLPMYKSKDWVKGAINIESRPPMSDDEFEKKYFTNLLNSKIDDDILNFEKEMDKLNKQRSEIKRNKSKSDIKTDSLEKFKERKDDIQDKLAFLEEDDKLFAETQAEIKILRTELSDLNKKIRSFKF